MTMRNYYYRWKGKKRGLLEIEVRRAARKNFEIGRILHLKFETRNLKLDWPVCAVVSPI